MKRVIWLMIAMAGVFAFAACGNGNEAADGGEGTVTKLRFTGIPDADKEKLTKQYEVVTAYLAKELGVEVEYVHVPDYSGAVTALASNQVDVVWLGGVTTVQAEMQTDDNAVLLACRESDKKFKSYFIAHKDLGIGKLNALKDLKGKGIADNSFTFGSLNSTSGHIMPRHFMGKAGIDPEGDFKGKAGYQASGGHSATLKAVQSGQSDIGALSFKTYDNAADGDKNNTEVIFATDTYVDYCMVGHTRLGDLNDKIAAAFAKLDSSNEEHQKVLGAFSADKFVKADPVWWDGIRGVLKDAYDKGILKK